MVITKTPFRMSFFGGGTDLESYFKENNGAVISTTFDKYCYVTIRHLPGFFDYKSEIAYSKIERVDEIDNIDHPAVRNALKMLNVKDVRLTYEADLPARSGLGTSSSFSVGMINALHALKGEYVDKRKLADEAIYLERILCNEAGGLQDQIAASYGGLNRINFSKDGYEVSPIIISNERKRILNDHLMLFFTGFTRFSSEIQKENLKNSNKNKYLQEMYELVNEAEKVLSSKYMNPMDFGLMLDHTWRLKKNTGSSVSTDSIDLLYEKGKNAGALGGKLLGAGGGGFVIFFVPPERQEKVKEAMGNLIHVPFKFEESGSKVIYYSSEELE